MPIVLITNIIFTGEQAPVLLKMVFYFKIGLIDHAHGRPALFRWAVGIPGGPRHGDRQVLHFIEFLEIIDGLV